MGGPVELSEEAWNRSLDINLGSVYRTCKAVLPHMLKQGRGAIINISSLAAIRWTGYPYFAYYTAKAAVNQATVALAMQYARHGIRANAILPGAVDTPLIYREISSQYASVDDMRDARNRAVPTGKMGSAWDIAHAAVFLPSDEAAFLIPQSIAWNQLTREELVQWGTVSAWRSRCGCCIRRDDFPRRRFARLSTSCASNIHRSLSY